MDYENDKDFILKKIIENVRSLGIDMIDEAKSGHPGIVLGAAPIISTLYFNHMKIDPKNDKWLNRDRFIMSSGHGSALLYSTLFMSGFDLSLEDLKKFRKLNSITPGHPEYNVTKGVDMSTGPLGEGFATSVGVAISERFLRSYFGESIFDYYTYVLCGDGDLMEGISYEAASIAGHLNLNKLIVLYDSNNVTLDGSLNSSFNEDVKARFEAMNWNYMLVDDGEDTNKISEAISLAKQSLTKPTIIEVKTTIGKFSKYEGTCKVHGSPLEVDDFIDVKKKLNVRETPFTISQESKDSMEENIYLRNRELITKWNEEIEKLDDVKKKDFELLCNSNKPIKILDIDYTFTPEVKDSTRNVSGKVINSLAKYYPFLIGGSADVSRSTMARINETSDNSYQTPLGRNINFGVRENAAGAIANGIALSNLTPFVSTFFSFSDYLKPSLRLSALMDLPVIYVFSHDSISVGEDGPTHQPIEQLVSLRSLPNFDTYRPGDANETIGAYKAILHLRKPAAIILGRNKVAIEENTKSNDVINGAYIVEKERDRLDGIIITSGEELELTMDIYRSLNEKGYGIRIISMPSMSRFEKQSVEYQKEIIPENVKTFVIERSSSLSWYKYTSKEYMFTIDTFGRSGNAKELDKFFGFDKEKILNEIEKKLNE